MPTDAETFVGEIIDVEGDPLVRIDAEDTGTVVIDSIDRLVYLTPAQARRLAELLNKAAEG